MLGIENYGVFLLSGIMLNIIPGADTMYILGRSISQGRKAGILSVLGISSGSLVHTMLASLGLSVILAQSAWAFNAVKLGGAGYLIYLGLKALLFPLAQPGVSGIDRQENLLKIYFQGMATNLLNPKVAIFFLAFLPQFVVSGNEYGILPFLVLGLTFITTGTLWCILLAIGSAAVTAKLRDKKQWFTVINRLTGLLFLGLGLRLLKTKMVS